MSYDLRYRLSRLPCVSKVKEQTFINRLTDHFDRPLSVQSGLRMTCLVRFLWKRASSGYLSLLHNLLRQVKFVAINKTQLRQLGSHLDWPSTSDPAQYDLLSFGQFSLFILCPYHVQRDGFPFLTLNISILSQSLLGQRYESSIMPRDFLGMVLRAACRTTS